MIIEEAYPCFDNCFITAKNMHSFSVEHKDGGCYDFSYAYVSLISLNAEHTVLKIKHSDTEIWIYGENLKCVFDELRKQKIDSIFIQSEVLNRNGETCCKILDVQYSTS